MSPYSRPPAPVHPALDFLRKVEVWQQAPGGTAGLAVTMPAGDEKTLAGLLAEFRRTGATPALEDQARYWLVGYREADPPLTTGQQAELDDVIHGSVTARQHRAQPRRRPVQTPAFWIVMAVITVLTAVIGTGIVHLLSGSSQGSPPPAGPVAAQPAGPQQGPLTGLQRFRADWRIPAAATAGAGSARQLVLLQDGLYYPAPWTLPAGDPGWMPSTSGGITAADVNQAAGTADVTDADGTTWTVAIGQPFVLASDPSVVFRILRDGTIQSMPQPHAIVVRTGA